MSAEEALRIIALFRIRLPKAKLRICGGRKQILAARQYESFAARADALMSGNYLTRPSEELEKDLQALAELDLIHA